MVAQAEKRADAPKPPGRFQKADVLLALGFLAAVLAISCIMVFARGDRGAAIGILWGWIVEVGLWVYVFLSTL